MFLLILSGLFGLGFLLLALDWLLERYAKQKERDMNLEYVLAYIEKHASITMKDHNNRTFQQFTIPIGHWWWIKEQLRTMEKTGVYSVTESSNPPKETSIKQLPPPSPKETPEVPNTNSGAVSAEGATPSRPDEGNAIEEKGPLVLSVDEDFFPAAGP